jgi:vanillate/3-O-methylgallate O-demethylase
MAHDGESLQDFIDRTPDLVDHFYNDARAQHFAAAGQKSAEFIPPAFSNWRDEQAAAADSAALLHQSHHMPELFVEGPDAVQLLKSVAVNTFENYGIDRGKQLVACTPRGNVITDCIAYRHDEESFELVSGAPLLNWVEYQAKTGGYDVELRRDESSNLNPAGRRIKYRFEIVGPKAGEIFDRLVEGGAPDIPFFRTGRVRIGGHDVVALRHGMIGSIAVELSGPYEEEEDVRSLILQAGEEFGIKSMGTQAYYSSLQGGWMPSPVPAVYTDPELQDYRRYLPATSWEAAIELGGSYRAPNITDYYVTPFDLGYGNLIKYDHDFFGKEALAQVPDKAKRTKVTLVWNQDDILRVMRSQFGPGPRYKSLSFPVIHYGWNPFDEVRSHQGELIGLSRQVSYSNPLGDVISLAMMDHGHAEIGSEVIITWGEPNGGSRKPQVEQHQQTTIRAVVASAPYDPNVQRATRQAKLA